jgi:DNA-binding FadR family transcriptional regulator
MALELLEAREMIEPNCVRLAARGTAGDFARIDRLLDAHGRRTAGAGRRRRETTSCWPGSA